MLCADNFKSIVWTEQEQNLSQKKCLPLPETPEGR